MASNAFGEALRSARQRAGLSLQQLGDIVGRTRSGISAIEKGRIGVERSPELVSQLEIALQLPFGTLARFLPEDHPARRIADMALQVVGYVVTDRSEPPTIALRELMRVSDRLLGCLGLQVIGNGLAAYNICDGDYLVYRRLLANEKPEVGMKLLLRPSRSHRMHLVECCLDADGHLDYVPMLQGEVVDKHAEVAGVVVAVLRFYCPSPAEGDRSGAALSPAAPRGS